MSKERELAWPIASQDLEWLPSLPSKRLWGGCRERERGDPLFRREGEPSGGEGTALFAHRPLSNLNTRLWAAVELLPHRMARKDSFPKPVAWHKAPRREEEEALRGVPLDSQEP